MYKMAIVLVLMMMSISAHATLYDVTYNNTDTVSWTGIVDTSTDTLTLSTFADNPGNKPIWTPTNPTNIVFHAVLGNLAAFDVSDTWDGAIGTTWGFLSDLTKPQINWNEGNFVGNSSRLGWGFGENNIGGTSPLHDEGFFGWTPYSASGNWGVAGGNVTVTLREEGAIPAPAPFALMSLGLLGLGYSRRKTA